MKEIKTTMTGSWFRPVEILQLLSSSPSGEISDTYADVIKNADWVIDLGPGAGEEGGHIVATGTPEETASNENSLTGQYLRAMLASTREYACKV